MQKAKTQQKGLRENTRSGACGSGRGCFSRKHNSRLYAYRYIRAGAHRRGSMVYYEIKYIYFMKGRIHNANRSYQTAKGNKGDT